MLSYALAIAVTLSSLVLFSTAFLISDIHRRDDFLWSGVGLFYALVLWFCARNITGAVLLGQAAATVLIVSYSWQTLKLRKAVANPTKASAINNFSVLQKLNGLLKRTQLQPQPVVIPYDPKTPAKVTEQEIAIPQTTSPESRSQKSNNKISSNNKSKSGVFGRLFGSKQKVAITNTKLDDILEEADQKTTATNPTSEPIAEVQPITEQKAAALNTVEPQPEIAKTEANKQIKVPQEQIADIKDDWPQEKAETSIPNTQPEASVVDVDRDKIPDTAESSEKTSTSEPETTLSIAEQPEVSSEDESATPNKMEAETAPDVKEVPEIKAVTEKKPSPLDSLETVEVAEVLEAMSEDMSSNRESDQSNIIEVTTTEINITTEVQKIEQNEDKTSDSEGV